MTADVLRRTPSVAAAQVLAEELLNGDRLLHTIGVATRANDLVTTIEDDRPEVLLAAAWLHDIGYSEVAVDTRFHPLDGARLLQKQGWSMRICRLVAHHSGARFVAGPLGLTSAMASFPPEDSPLADALTYADQTTGPRGQFLPLEHRMASMLTRHGPTSVQAMVHHTRSQDLRDIAERVRSRIPTHPHEQIVV